MTDKSTPSTEQVQERTQLKKQSSLRNLTADRASEATRIRSARWAGT